jgi:hypothetical protein
MRQLAFCILVLSAWRSNAQDTCIVADTIVCLNSCMPITYNGPGSDTATYAWTSNCGTFTNPASKQPGDHCYLFMGNCILQVIVTEPGMDPDTCSIEIVVASNPDGVLDGDTTICAGHCTSLITQFLSGTPPFAYSIDDGFIVNFYTSDGMADTIEVCPPFTTTYTLNTITDTNGCINQGELNSVDVNVAAGIEASITQTGNTLCANPPGQNYQWYDCTYSQLLGNAACFTMPADGCYCVIVADQQTGLCVDTLCNDFIIPCDLSCELIAPDSVCSGDDFVFFIQHNASASGIFTYDLESDGNPGLPIISQDSVIFPAGDFTWIKLTLVIDDLDCQTACTDSIYTSTYTPTATFGNDIASCDSCTTIPIILTGTPPFTIHISDGASIDTISNIADSTFEYTACPMAGDTAIYTLINVTDSISQCNGVLIDESIAVFIYGSPIAGIVQQGNQLCAAAVSTATFEWFTCDSMQLLTFDSCFSIVDTACYCLVVTDAFCTDTICDTFNAVPCELTCEIEAQPTACLEESFVIAYSGNASPTATYNWLIDVPGFPMMPVSGNDTVVLSYSEAGTYHVTLTVFDLGCLSVCSDSIQVIAPQSTASICCTSASCDTCALLELNFTGIAPWTAYVTNGLSVDTINGITTSPYFHEICPQLDTTITYSLAQVIDGTNTCPAAITGDTLITVTLYSNPSAFITQHGDTLCAPADTLLSYGWYTCPNGSYLDTNRCFVPVTSGCYCVAISTPFGCVDTACYNIILSDVSTIETTSLAIHPNPSSDHFTVLVQEPVTWSICDVLGQQMDTGHWDAGRQFYSWAADTPPGIYMVVIRNRLGKNAIARLIRQ